jgi:glycosyltransferase involved in cell wall biosynthesis
MAVGRDDERAECLRNQGVETHVIPGLEPVPRAAGILAKIRQLPRNLVALHTASTLCHSVAADAICINAENMPLMPRIGPLNGRRTVVLVRGVRFAELGLLARMFFAVQRTAVWRYVAVSRTVGDLLVGIGIPQRQVEVIYNGVDVDLFQPGPRRPSLREALGIPADAPVFGDVSVVSPRKGAHHLVEVLHRVRQTVPQAYCLIVGGANVFGGAAYCRRVRRCARELGVSDGLVLTGERQDVPDILRSMDVLVHPSETEAFGRVLAEAMATGLPAVGFDVGAVGELIDHGRTGNVVKPFDESAMADAVVRLLNDASLRQQLGQAGREKVLRNYDLRHTISDRVDLLEEACAIPPPALRRVRRPRRRVRFSL